MRKLVLILLITTIICKPIKQEGPDYLFEEPRTWSEIENNEDYSLSIPVNRIFTFYLPNDIDDESVWDIENKSSIKNVEFVGKGLIVPSTEMGTTKKQIAFSFRSLFRGTERVLFLCAKPWDKANGKKYIIEFTVQ